MSIKITGEQANAIEERLVRYKESKEDVLRTQLGHQHSESNGRYCYVGGTPSDGLTGMSVVKLARALYEGYEVVEEYKPGDWITNKSNLKVFRLLSDAHCSHYNKIKTSYRHSTPEEVQKEREGEPWKKMNRKPGEIKKGDIGVNRNGLPYYYKGSIEIAYKEGDLIELYPVESRISLIVGESDE